jgi:hypothetical protein
MAGSCSWNVPTQFDISFFAFSDSAHLREGFRNYSVPTRHNCDCDGRCNPTAARTTVDVPEDPSTVGAEEVVSPCQSRLAEIAAFKPLPPITGLGDCTATDVVELDAVLPPDNHRVNFSPTAILRCPMAEAVTHWVRNDVAPTITTLGEVAARRRDSGLVRLPPA